MASAVGVSQPEVSLALRRLAVSGLLRGRDVHRSRRAKFLFHGVPVVWPAVLGAETRGMPTAWAMIQPGQQRSLSDGPVWPDSEGRHRGPILEPLYKTVIHASKHDDLLYRWLALIDQLRVGSARERGAAEATIWEEVCHGTAR